MKIGSTPQQPVQVETPKAKAPPPPPPPPPPQVRQPLDSFVSGQNALRQQQLLGTNAPSSLSTERLGDGNANCLERAMQLAGPQDSIVLLSDQKDGVGHALVRKPDGSVIDPNFPNVSYQSVGQWQAMNPRYGDPRTVPASDMRQVLSTPPGPQRDARIAALGLSDVAQRMVADGATPSGSSVGASGGVTVGSDGQVTFTQQTTLQNAESEFEAGRISGTLSAGPLAETEVSLSWNPSQPNPDGTYAVTLSYSAQVGTQAEGELSIGPFGVSGGRQAGVSTSREYTLNLTDEQLRQVAAGTFPLPSIADPLSLPEGSSVTMSTGAFQNQSGGISYGPLSLSSETSQTRDYSVGVERTGQNTVRVTVGPSETVEQRLELGLSFGDVASAHIGRDRSVTGSNLVSAEFDLSTTEGRAAYEDFLRTGQLPTQEGPGITDVYHEQTLSYEGGLDAGLNIGEVVDLGYQFWTEDLSYTTRTDNGVTTVTANGHTSTGNGFEIGYTQNPDGSHTLNSVSLEMQVPGRDQPVKISLDGPEGLRSMREVAFRQAQSEVYDQLRYSVRELEGASDGEIKQWIQDTFPPEHRLYRLTAEPGEPGFSYQGWIETYHEYDPSRAWPSLPNLTNTLLQMPEPPDMNMAADLFFGLNGIGGPNNLLEPYDVGTGSFQNYFELGLGNMPGVTVEGL